VTSSRWCIQMHQLMHLDNCPILHFSLAHCYPHSLHALIIMASTAPAIDPNQTIYVRNLNEKINKIGTLLIPTFCLFWIVPLICWTSLMATTQGTTQGQHRMEQGRAVSWTRSNMLLSFRIRVDHSHLQDSSPSQKERPLFTSPNK
jgi:hypothetical protein